MISLFMAKCIKVPSLVDSIINIDPIYLKLKYAIVKKIFHIKSRKYSNIIVYTLLNKVCISKS